MWQLGVYVAITGSTWPMWCLLKGCHVHPVTATYILQWPRRPRNLEEVGTAHSFSRKLSYVAREEWVALRKGVTHAALLWQKEASDKIEISCKRAKCVCHFH